MAFIAANISFYAELRLNGPGRHPAGCDTVESLEQAGDAAVRLVDTPAVARVAVDVVEAMEGRLLDTPATFLLGHIVFGAFVGIAIVKSSINKDQLVSA